MSEFHRMWDAGVFETYPDLELIGGDIYEMPADGPRTKSWNAAINLWLARTLPRHLVLMPDKTLDLGEEIGSPKPDFFIFPRAVKVADVRGPDVLLAIEVSDTTVEFDRDIKAPLYAKGGVREHWRIECETRCIFVHRLQADGGYGDPEKVAFDGRVQARLIPELHFRLADLDFPD